MHMHTNIKLYVLTPNLRRVIMVRSKYRNKFIKNKSEISRRANTKQRNYCGF